MRLSTLSILTVVLYTGMVLSLPVPEGLGPAPRPRPAPRPWLAPHPQPPRPVPGTGVPRPTTTALGHAKRTVEADVTLAPHTADPTHTTTSHHAHLTPAVANHAAASNIDLDKRIIKQPHPGTKIPRLAKRAVEADAHPTHTTTSHHAHLTPPAYHAAAGDIKLD
ncbi:hypothetical protein FRC17_004752, partial [Serendipita sp. 399]